MLGAGRLLTLFSPFITTQNNLFTKMLWKIIRNLADCIDDVIEKSKKHFLPSMITLYILIIVVFATINWIIFWFYWI